MPRVRAGADCRANWKRDVRGKKKYVEISWAVVFGIDRTRAIVLDLAAVPFLSRRREV